MYHFDWIRRHAERTPDKLALVDAHTGRQYTYAQFNQRANRLASFLRDELGVQQGDRVSILAQNSSDYFEVLFACGKIGAILNTLNWRLAVPELEFILNDCTPRVMLCEPEFAVQMAALRSQISCESYIVMGDSGSDGDWTYEQALAAGSPTDFVGPRLKYEETWAILYTSGTTGRPKGAQVTYGNFFYNAVGMGRAIDLTSEDVNLNVLPTFHAGGLGLYAGPIFHAGGTLVVMRAFEPGKMLDLIAKWGVTKLLLVPAIYLALLQYPGFDEADLSSVVHWGSGGSSLPPSLVQQYAKKGIIIQQGFGMTETGPTVFIIDKENAVRKAGSVGKPVLHTDVCIMDRQGNVLGPNEVGELCIRGGNVTSGYWNRPEATAEAIKNEWLHSGDAAMYDEEGFYTIVDRWKDMFISGGENVYPAEVENVIYQHPAVAETAVIGVPHPQWQETGRALVVLKAGQTATEQEIIDFCQGKLARYKIPKSVIFLDKPLPRTAAGKVLKRELRKTYGRTVE
ncbi:MAG: long-chain fatty acid--CoA ligase [Ardenticatenaceae bacterium]|nr:long-chain fatty acid--CoA ligase [Ardenticatenaceae bacterium]MCB9444401.1 long-chain fatty acid--CoA ligase [Ardenticatenaceae bacterium]